MGLKNIQHILRLRFTFILKWDKMSVKWREMWFSRQIVCWFVFPTVGLCAFYESLDIYNMYLICWNPGLDWNNNLRHDFDSGTLWCFSALWPDQVFPLKTLKHSHWWYYWMCSTDLWVPLMLWWEQTVYRWGWYEAFFITSLLSKPWETPQCIIRYFLYVDI